MKNKKLLLSLIIVIVFIGVASWYYLHMKKAVVWDGTYQMTGSLACTGNIPGLTSVPMDTDIIIVSNKIVDQKTGKTFDVGRNGKAKEAIELTENGMTTAVDVDYQFYQEEKVNKFTASGLVSLSASKDGKDYFATCTGDTTGVIK
jgi:hypothetical protein